MIKLNLNVLLHVMSKRKRFSPVEDATAHILSGKDKPCLEERFINSHKGRGVFASMSIDKGCFILEYRGELLSQEESQTRQNRYNETENTFLFEFDWNGRQWCIDASKEDGSLGRLVNDNNKTPNCKVKKISVEGKPHLCLFSVKAIASGEELTYNYGDSDWPWRTQLNQAVPHNEENIPSEDSTHFPDKINCPKPAEQIGSYLSEPRPSNSGQSTDHNSDHSSTASDMMENHSQVNQAVPHNEENIPSEEGTHLSDKINCPKPAEQIGSYLSEPRPSNSGQSTDHNSDHSSTASDMMENHSQVNQAVPHNEENIPLEEDICFPSNMSKKSTEQVMPCGTLTKLQLSNNFRLKENQDRCAQRYEQLSTLETKRGMTDYSQNNESEISCEESSFSDYSDNDYVPGTDCSSSDNSCESEELNICHVEPAKGGAVEFKSTTDNSTSSSYHRSTSVTPMPTKMQKNRYKKIQYCAYCQKPYSKIARHLEFVHRNELEVAKAFSFDKRSKERRVRLRLLKSRGNFAHNAAVSKAGNGEMVACRRPKEVKSTYDFTHCIHCQGLYNRKTLWRHIRTCPQNPKNENRTIGQKRVQSINSLTLPPPVDVSKSLWTIACEMVNDEVSDVVRNDRYILLLGEQMYNRLKSHSGRNYYIKQKMREVARLLITARSLTPIHNMEDFIQPCNFPHVIKAVRAVAGFSEEANTYKIPSLALKLGHSLVKIANSVECNALMSGRDTAAESARNFRRLYESKWNEVVSAAALTTLGEAKWNKPQVLPFTDDVKTLHSFLNSKQQEYVDALQEKPNDKNFANLCKVMLTQIIIFNRRREGEVSRMNIQSYTSRDQAPMHKDIAVGLSDFEKKLCGYFQRVEIRGKRGRKVPVLLTPNMIVAMDLLVNMRERCQVPVENKHLFARPGALSHYRGGDCIHQYARASGAKHPDALCSTKLRKQVATMSTVLNLKDNEMDQLANFLGHDIRVHREFYRLPESTLQLAKISKLLIAMEKGALPELQGKGLDGITIDPQDEMDVSSNSSSDEAEPQTLSCRRQEYEDHVNGSQKSLVRRPKSSSMVDLDDANLKQGTKVSVKKKWSEEEVGAVEKHLMHFIRSCRVPGKTDCVSCLLAEPEALKNRDWSAIKFYINNRITALKRQQSR
ncbi:uncharacterized protein LOC113063327 isoform X1 [Carassius auratus]|uniref:Uncharacterized protein LOC113063327 isoform X1 n=3 Tax=Carassius TaxID=7956 RepID=A0A6P6M0V7_CARAU|nr:uncharacterized protein LOC113063327 isoform X1 [Carassius auratus]